MRPEDVLERLGKRPFEPFRICMSDGVVLEVRHPEMCIVSRRTAYVGVPDPKRPGAATRVAHCALLHITRIEPLDGAKLKTKRGHRK